jgi:hypothetical protein
MTTPSEHKREMKWVKRIGLSLLAAATIVGTYSGSEGVIPFITKKTGTSYGINLGIIGTEQTPYSKIYGVNIGMFNKTRGNSELNGLEIGLENNPFDNNSPKIVNGLQIGLYNNAQSGNLMQIGIFNKIQLQNGKPRYSIIFNCAFEGGQK